MKVKIEIPVTVSKVDKDTEEVTEVIESKSFNAFISETFKSIEKKVFSKVKPSKNDLKVLQRFQGKTFDTSVAIQTALNNRISENEDMILSIGSVILEKIKHFQENMIITTVDE